MSVSEIMGKYTAGELPLDRANAQLEDLGVGFRLDPERNRLTQAEKEETVVGYFPHQANGWGLLDTGTGSLDKVEIVRGRLADCDCGDMAALCFVAGKLYHVQGSQLVD